MRFFVCVTGAGGGHVTERRRLRCESYARRRGIQPSWHLWRGLSVMTAGNCSNEDAAISAYGPYVAVGTVRLDNRGELDGWLKDVGTTRPGGAPVRDLDLVLQLIAIHGTRYVPNVLGDFAFVVWNAVTHSAVAACDAFAVRTLCYAESDGSFAFASHAEALATRDDYEVQYLAERVAYCNPISPGLTVFAGVRMLPPATFAVVERGKLTLRRYWSADDFEPDHGRSVGREEAVARTRQLLTTSVSLRLDPRGGNWAELSGGLDSSGIVSIVQQHSRTASVQHGLDGTLTYVDRPEVQGSDREFAGDVSREWGVRNECLTGISHWQSEKYAAPFTDYPDGYYSVFPRSMQAREIMEHSAGRVLLTGLGGDELFGGSRFYYADLLARGRLKVLFAELTHRTATQRRSFWALVRRSLVLPLLPRALSDRLERKHHLIRLPDWYERRLFRACGIRNFGESTRSARPGRIGRMFHDDHVMSIESLIGREIGRAHV